MRRTVPAAALLCLAFAPGGRRAHVPDFDLEVLPLLQRQGCASAYCHGSATGRGGFKLSLFGSDPAADHAMIRSDRGGRRLDLIDPEQSLLLRKPSKDLPHEGGLKLREGGAAYSLVRRWIAAGAPRDPAARARLLGLELQRRADDSLRVLAQLRDRQQPVDVTHLATFSSSDPRVVEVDRAGRLQLKGPGMAQVFARYVGQTAGLEICRPEADCPPTPLSIPARGLDRPWLQQLQRLHRTPADPAAPRVLARRLFLDLADRLPTPRELKHHLAQPAAERVAATARRLLQGEGFVRRFGRLLADWWEVPQPGDERVEARRRAAQVARQTLQRELAAGTSLAAMARARLDTDRRLMDRFEDPRDRAEWAGRSFLGIRLGCARCHDSPVDRWRQDQHLSFAAMFASPRPAPQGGMREGILFHPGTGEAVPPRLLPLGGEAGATTDSLGSFVTDPGHGLFYRNMANRVFGALMGEALVSPADDHRLSNPPRNPALLDELAAVLKEQGLRGLVLAIVQSRLYQQQVSARSEQHEILQGRPSRSMDRHTLRLVLQESLGLGAIPTLPASPLAAQLALLNNPRLRQELQQSSTLRALQWLAPDADTRLRDLYLLLLGRPPSAAETRALLPELQDDQDGSALRDLCHALINSRAFRSIR